MNYYTIWDGKNKYDKKKLTLSILAEMKLIKDQYDDTAPNYNSLYHYITIQKNNMISYKDEQVELTKYEDYSKEDLKEFFIKYEIYKEKHHIIEFDDFMNLAIDILNKDKMILDSYREKYKYILADEYQDVSISQAKLIKMINDTNTMIVGDPLQAIYSFRGGCSDFIMNFDKDYNDVTVINLSDNYRCSEEIVFVSNEFADTISDSKHRNYKRANANKESTGKPIIIESIDQSSEAKRIASIINKYKDKYNYDDFAVLSRTNFQLSEIQDVFARNQIPFDISENGLFYELPEIRVLLSYLFLSMDTSDNKSFKEIYNKPNRGLYLKFIEYVEEYSNHYKTDYFYSMDYAVNKYRRFQSGVKEIKDTIKLLRTMNFKHVGEMVWFLLRNLNFESLFNTGESGDDGRYSEKMDNANMFMRMCERYKTVKELKDYVDEIKKQAEESKDKDAVHLMTIHRSKGLEFPVVFIIGCNNNILPHSKNDNEEDERRLFYVGMTRAEKELILSYTDEHILQNANGKSPFLIDIESYCEVIE